MSGETVFIGYGSNFGDRQEICDRALTLMGLLPHSRVTGISSYYETEPIDPNHILGQIWFYNGVVRIETSIKPRSLLDILQETEKALGRDQTHRAGPRTIDFDILFYGQEIINEPGLTIPHPRLHTRGFVLIPMVELDPTWHHPVLNQTIKELLDRLEDSSQVRKLDMVPGSKYSARPGCSTPFS